MIPLALGPRMGATAWAEEQLLDESAALLERGHGVLMHAFIRNRDRAVGARLAGVIARRWGDNGLPAVTIICRYTGSAGPLLAGCAAER